MAGILEALAGKKVEELRSRMECSIQASERLIKALDRTCKVMEKLTVELGAHRDAMNQLVEELKRH